MKKINSFNFFVVSLALLFATQSSAKDKDLKGYLPLNKPFDSAVVSLPRNFYGHDFELIYKSLAKITKHTEKSEFESKDEFRKKVEGFSSRIKPISVENDYALLLNNLPISNTFSNNQAVNVQFFSISYDAEKQIVKISNRFLSQHSRDFSGSPDYANQGEEFAVVDLSRRYLSKDNYIGTTRFGVDTEILYTHYKINSIGLFLNDLKKDDKLGLHVNPFEIELPMKSNEARVNLKNITYLLIVNIIPPYAYHNKTISRYPTLDDPRHEVQERKIVVTKLKDVWIINKVTGEIYSKFQTAYEN